MPELLPSFPVAKCQVLCAKSVGEPKMTAVGFEPTQLALVELESTPLDHSGELSY